MVKKDKCYSSSADISSLQILVTIALQLDQANKRLRNGGVKNHGMEDIHHAWYSNIEKIAEKKNKNGTPHEGDEEDRFKDQAVTDECKKLLEALSSNSEETLEKSLSSRAIKSPKYRNVNKNLITLLPRHLLP